MKTITINNREFELSNKKIEYPYNLKRMCLYECYNKPSKTKLDIVDDWEMWSSNGDYFGCLGICSYNCNFFTLNGIMTHNESGKKYYVVITKSHNKAYEII